MFLYTPKAVYAASERQYTLQQVEKFKYLGVVYTSDGRWSVEVDAWIAKANAFLRELYCCGHKTGNIQTPQSFQFLNWSLFRS